jgi:hypothetical protein
MDELEIASVPRFARVACPAFVEVLRQYWMPTASAPFLQRYFFLDRVKSLGYIEKFPRLKGEVLNLLGIWRGASFAYDSANGLGEPSKGAPHGDETTCFAAHA